MNQNNRRLLYQQAYSLTEIDAIAYTIVGLLKNQSKLWLWDAEMGAGKTTMIAALCKVLGSSDIVSSPTYGFINIYNCTAGNIAHIDAYRLEDEHEAIAIGIEDYLFDDKNFCMVEWPSKIVGLLPDHYIYIHLYKITNTQREITLFAVP